MNSKWEIAGKRCLVTGATNGIGRALAVKLAEMGADVIVGGRSSQKCADVQQQIKSLTGRDSDIFVCNFNSLADLRKGAEKLTAKNAAPLDVLINNAGVFTRGREETEDGLEKMFGVNHLAPFLLTELLLEQLRSRPQARIVFVASDAHRFSGGPPDFNDPDSLQLISKYSGFKGYGRSKAYNIMYSTLLAEQLADTQVTVNAMHPGAVRTGLGGLEESGNFLVKALMKVFFWPFFRTPDQGADTALWLATDPDLSNSSGGYYKNRRSNNPKPWLLRKDLQQQLLTVSRALIEEKSGSL